MSEGHIVIIKLGFFGFVFSKVVIHLFAHSNSLAFERNNLSYCFTRYRIQFCALTRAVKWSINHSGKGGHVYEGFWTITFGPPSGGEEGAVGTLLLDIIVKFCNPLGLSCEVR